MESPLPALLVALKNEYRQQAAWLAAGYNHSKTPPAQDAPSDSVGKDATAAACPSLRVSQHMIQSLPDEDESTQRMQVSSVRPQIIGDEGRTASSLGFPLCQTCLAPLQPGWNGTKVKLRSIPTFTTQTRPDHQQVSKAKKKKAKKVSSVEIVAAQAAPSTLLVYCGVCAAVNPFPGDPKKPNKSERQKKAAAKTTAQKTSSKEKATVKASQRKKPASSSFIQLPPPAHLGQKKRIPTTLALGGKKKKKQKTNLMNFLSSLND
jgi:hypothetical protein